MIETGGDTPINLGENFFKQLNKDLNKTSKYITDKLKYRTRSSIIYKKGWDRSLNILRNFKKREMDFVC